jgi:predicted nucleotidyltransferase
MNVSAPILDIVPGPRGHVLTTLARLTGASTGRALAAQAGVPTATTARILRDLVEAGIVDAVSAGNAVLYRLNRDHIAAGALAAMADLRFDLVEDIRAEIKTWRVPAIAAWLFGSTARGDGDRDSDIDLLVVRPLDADPDDWVAQVGELAARIERRTGNAAQFVEHTPQSFAALETAKSPLIGAVRVEGIELVSAGRAAIAAAAAN